MYKTVLLAYDGSSAGNLALTEGSEIALWGQSNLHLIAVRPEWLTRISVEANQYQISVKESDLTYYQEILESGVSRLMDAGLNATGVIVTGDPVKQILIHADRVCADLIVVGQNRCYGWFDRWWKCPVSAKLVEIAPCSVLVAALR